MRCKVTGYRTCGVVLALVTGLAGAAPIASAQTAADKAVADSLFNEGKTLIAKQNDAVAWATACERFEASFAKFPQLGTQIALASCYEKTGKLASAWATFRAAASLASKAQDKRQAFAEQRVSEIESRLARLVIRVSSPTTMPGLVVKRDGNAIVAAELDSALPIDPGEHVIEASAPGRIGWTTRISVSTKPGVVEVPVPVLEKVAEKVVVVDHREERRMRRASVYIMGGGAVAGLSSIALGVVARSRWNDSKKSCTDGICDPAGLDKAHSARTIGNVATGVGLFGAGALVAGAILFFVTPHDEAKPVGDVTAIRVLPSVDTASAGLTVSGGF